MRQLTVAIPTFDRPLDLEATLNQIGPQLNDQCVLHVVDNCSQCDIEEIVQNFREQFSTVIVKYTRNSVNIGASANFMRCFEVCDTPWLWLLSDDDMVLDNAIETILATIHQHPECTYINFKNGGHLETYRPNSVKISGFDELVLKMERFDDQIFISTNIYNAKVFKQYLNIGHHFAYSLAPMFAINTLIMSQNNKECLLSKHSISKSGPRKPPEKSWGILPFILGIYSLLDLPMKKKTRAILRYKIGFMAPSYLWVAFSLALQAKNIDGAYPTALYSFLQYIDRREGATYLSFRRFFAKFLIVFFLLPRWLLVKIISLLNGIKRGRNATALSSQSLFQRT